MRPKLTFNANKRGAAGLYLRTLRGCMGGNSSILSANYKDNVLSVTSLLFKTRGTINISVSRLTIGATHRGNEMGNFARPRFAIVYNGLTSGMANGFSIITTGVITSIIVVFSSRINTFVGSSTIFVASNVVTPHTSRMGTGLYRGKFGVVRAHHSNS